MNMKKIVPQQDNNQDVHRDVSSVISIASEKAHQEKVSHRYFEANSKLNLFSYHPQLAGAVFWHENGFKLYDNLKKFIWRHHEAHGYRQVKSPIIDPISLFVQSGHWDKYKDLIYDLDSELALRPMSCPNHIFLYNSRPHSWRELPVKIFEFGEVFRKESSGSLQSLFRQRQFCQDDSHIFLSIDNLSQVINDYVSMAKDVYSELGFPQIDYKISLRPQIRSGDDKLWDLAESILIKELDYLNPEIIPGDGAFYGPKLELHIKDSLGRSWQLGVLQLDFVLPKNFDLSYISSSGSPDPVVIIHHAVLGSLERSIGIILENFSVNLPSFLHPLPIIVLPVSDQFLSYAEQISKKFNYLIDSSSRPLKEKIAINLSRGSQIIVVGSKEENLFKKENVFYGSYRENNKNILRKII